MPSFVVGHGGIRNAEKKMARAGHIAEEVLRWFIACLERSCGALHHQVETVDLLPHLQRDVLPRDAGILARRHQTRVHRVWIPCVEYQESDDIALRHFFIVLGKQCFITGRTDQRKPLFFVIARKIKLEPRIHIDESCDILRALNIAAHPIKRIGDAAQHDCS